MSAPTVELTGEEREVLALVDAKSVGFSRGRYFVIEPGQRDVHPLVQRLRAMKLVVLARWDGVGRMPPTRLCQITTRGEEVLAATSSPVS